MKQQTHFPNTKLIAKIKKYHRIDEESELFGEFCLHRVGLESNFYFSATGEIWEKTDMKHRPRGNEDYKRKEGAVWQWSMGGCLHDDLLKHFPEMKLVVDLHLSTVQGYPMYHIENGRYHLNKKFEVGVEYLRITEEEGKKLLETNNRAYRYGFAELLDRIGITTRWQEEARQAFDLLEIPKPTQAKLEEEFFYKFEPHEVDKNSTTPSS